MCPESALSADACASSVPQAFVWSAGRYVVQLAMAAVYAESSGIPSERLELLLRYDELNDAEHN